MDTDGWIFGQVTRLIEKLIRSDISVKIEFIFIFQRERVIRAVVIYIDGRRIETLK